MTVHESLEHAWLKVITVSGCTCVGEENGGGMMHSGRVYVYWGGGGAQWKDVYGVEMLSGKIYVCLCMCVCPCIHACVVMVSCILS